MTWDGIERRKDYGREPEDLGWIKKALIGSIIGLMAHFGGGIWWAATQTAKLDFVQQQIIAMREELKSSSSDRYYGSDAQRDFAVVNGRLDRNESRILVLEQNRLSSKGGLDHV